MTPERCPCGLGDSEVEMCIDGEVYGYCESHLCGGYCVAVDTCTCTCHTMQAEQAAQ
jgi:hypothetical protein